VILLTGCREAQGYHISRTLPAESFPKWLTDYTPAPDWLYYGQHKLTLQQQKIILLQLTSKQWFENVLSLLR